MKAFYTFDSGSQGDARCEQMIGVFDFSIRSQSIVSAYHRGFEPYKVAGSTIPVDNRWPKLHCDSPLFRIDP
jgi:hypothetical protein